MSLSIHLDKFEGPLGLLLYLIRKDEMDIFDINIHQITQQYLEYIKAMKRLDLEVAGEFIAMAATLIHIKSRMLLPTYDENGDEVENLDPRKELVQKLLDYQKYQEASAKLYERPLLGRDIWLRGKRENIKVEEEDDIVVEDNPLFALIRSYRWVVKNIKKNTHKVFAELQSIAERVLEIKDRLIIGQKVIFRELLNKEQVKAKEGLVGHVLITFLSLLELGKLGLVSLYQTEVLGDIYVEAKKQIDGHVIQNVEDYESEYVDPQAKEALFANPQEVAKITENISEELDAEEGEEGQQLELGVLEEEEESSSMMVENSNDQGYVVEAATDDEIDEEEKRLRLYNHEDLQESEV